MTTTVVSTLALAWLWWPVAAVYGKKKYFAGVAGSLALILGPSVATAWARVNIEAAYSYITPLQVASGLIVIFGLSLIVLGVLRDVVALCLKLGKRPLSAKTLVYASGWLSLAAVLTVAWGAYGGLKAPVVVETEVELVGLPQELEGLRVGLLADIHASEARSDKMTKEIVKRTMEAAPDLILLPGDMADGEAAKSAHNLAPIKGLSAPYGVFAATGNHEIYGGYAGWKDAVQSTGVTFLENESKRVTINGKEVAISGIGDPAYSHAHRGTGQAPAPNIAAVAKQAEGADLHILIAHQPKLAHENSKYNVDLQVSGHTHGGHILGVDRLIVAPANNGFVRGAYALGDMLLWVSPGAGHWAGFSVRLGVPATIDILKLKRKI